MPSGKIKIVVTGGQPLFRHGICAAIASHPDMEVISIIENSCASVEKLKKLKPDVIIMDDLWPGCAVRKCATIISAVAPAKVIILSAIPSFDCANHMFDLGAVGYLLKNCVPEEVSTAIQAIYKGKLYISRQIAQQSRMLQLAISQNQHTKKLTPKEREVLCLITAGYTVKHIAAFMGIKAGTVNTFKKRIREKLHINNSFDLAKFAIRNGFTSLD